MVLFTFSEYKEQITDAINKLVEKDLVLDRDGFWLLDGISMKATQDNMYENNYVGHDHYYPTVSVVAKSNGIIHTFALRALLPDINF